jgi:hypothetical protein
MERVNIKIEGSFSDLPCVYKMKLGKTKKFFIWKTNKLKPSLVGMSKDLQRKIDKGCDDQDIFCKLASYMRARSVRNITVEVLVETDNLVDLLDQEKNILNEAKSDRINCLNSSFEPYIPGWIKTCHIVDKTACYPLVDPEKVAAPSFFSQKTIEVPYMPVEKIIHDEVNPKGVSFFNGSPGKKQSIKTEDITMDNDDITKSGIHSLDYGTQKIPSTESLDISMDDIKAMAEAMKKK